MFYYSQLFWTKTKGRWTFSSNLFQQNMLTTHTQLDSIWSGIHQVIQWLSNQTEKRLFFLLFYESISLRKTNFKTVAFFVVAVFVSVRGERYVTIMLLFFRGGGSVQKYLVLNFPILTTSISRHFNKRKGFFFIQNLKFGSHESC